jgi:hypothetical protein
MVFQNYATCCFLRVFSYSWLSGVCITLLYCNPKYYFISKVFQYYYLAYICLYAVLCLKYSGIYQWQFDLSQFKQSQNKFLDKMVLYLEWEAKFIMSSRIKVQRYEQILNTEIIIWSLRYTVKPCDNQQTARTFTKLCYKLWKMYTVAQSTETLESWVWRPPITSVYVLSYCVLLRPHDGPVLHMKKKMYKMAVELLTNWNTQRH